MVRPIGRVSEVRSTRLWLLLIVVVTACASGGKESPDAAGSSTDASGCAEFATESCNGVDDDCDGKIDETYTMLGMTCSAGVGACANNGHYVCSTDHTMTVCDAVVGTPGATELCNAMDDDCDGKIDEGLMLMTACDGADADLCADGVLMCNGSGAVVCSDDATSKAELCNGMDDNCNGSIDEGFNVGTACDGIDSDVCMRGQVACNGSGGVTCVNDMPNSTEICNNADDDCDGVIDNGFNKTSDINNCGTCGTACTNAHGTTSCSASVCAPVCTTYWGDMDTSRVNGCECDGTAYEPSNLVGTTAGNWVNLGTYSDCDHYHSWQANIVPTSDDDFYEAYISNDTFCTWESKLYLSQIPSGTDYDLQLYQWNGSAWVFLTSSLNLGNANESIDMSSYDEAWYGFRVVHYAGSSCADYKLTLCDGSGACGP